MAEPISPETHAAYERIHATAEFAELKNNYRSFVLPMTVAFMVWYLFYVIASNWMPGFMNTQVFGTINIALLFGLLQFITTFGIAWWYARYSARKMDPLADDLRDGFEREVGQ
ncbi:DUF485 domain-containing protein [Aeromicrobium sp. YIM 150415]|uniref:DUF485 domain-containing protein n=1 Tax=Aeromicrobium sp. YIM 150415 TaxID=2803912 RepID=UPI0019627A6E|nr:DUF485 domain-containing protein [Aeromicrobium sp. YIM 150415]MBM9464146.1 DUF485 domain-containing protein [Aeromicrobium sp. YIM 150415]